MPLARERLYTVEDIADLPDGQRAELIDGVIYDMSTPSRQHQKISMALATAIQNYIAAQKGNCEVYAAPFAVFLDQNDYNYFEPDITVVCDPSKLSDRGCEGVPDWIIEIVSPSTQSRDYGIKLFKYRMAGVREYWIIDQRENRIAVYDFENDSMYKAYTFSEQVPVGIYDGDLQIDFSKLIN
ncbi:MAG: Uma2 family endonuclease [Lachnospiraceae bacterium]|nr:Uma2 family endonuclease [Lachnospiraceae bacterium]